MAKTIAVIGTLDTKGVELEYLTRVIKGEGLSVIIVDVGVFPQSLVTPDYSREDVAARAGTSVSEMLARKDRKLAVHTMREGGSALLKDLCDHGLFSGIVSVGGGTGTHIASGIMRSLPIGLPKLMVSTVASRDMSGIIGSTDITLMHAVCDIIGLNFMTRKLLGDAARAISSMVRNELVPEQEKIVVGLTSYGPLNDCAFMVQRGLEALGYEVIPFHAIGTGSMAMEDMIAQGLVTGVMDLSLHEFVDHIYDGYCKYIGPSRLVTAGMKRVPHVILPGGLDMIAFECESVEEVPRELRGRKFLSHDFRSFVKTSKEDLLHIAEIVSARLNRYDSPRTFVIPRNGWSKADTPGGPFWDPETSAVFVDRIKRLLGDHITIVECNANINDQACVEIAVSEFHRLAQGYPAGANQGISA